MAQHGLLSRLIENAGLISVVGALILFFSWVITNTFGVRYTRLKQSVENAESTFRLYQTLHGLRDQLNSLAMEVVHGRKAADASRFRSGQTGNTEFDAARERFDLTRLSAHQITELNDFAGEMSEFSRAVGSDTSASADIIRIAVEVSEISTKVREKERRVEELSLSDSSDPSDMRKAIDDYVDYVRNAAIPKMPELFRQAVEASNTRRREGAHQLALAKTNAQRASRVATALYIAGTLLVLGGQYLDKVYGKKAKPASTSVAVSSGTA